MIDDKSHFESCFKKPNLKGLTMMCESLMATNGNSDVVGWQAVCAFDSLGDLLFSKRAYRTGIEVYKYLVKWEPDNERYRVLLAQAHHHAKQYNVSIKLYISIISHDINAFNSSYSCVAWMHLIDAYANTNNYKDAIAAQTKFINIYQLNSYQYSKNKNFSSFDLEINLHSLARMLYETKQYPESSKIYATLLASGKTQNLYRLYYANTLLKCNKKQCAMKVYKSCLNQNQRNYIALINLKLLLSNHSSLPTSFYKVEKVMREFKLSKMIEPCSAIVHISGSDVTVWVGTSIKNINDDEFAMLTPVIENKELNINHNTFLALGCIDFKLLATFIRITKMENWGAPLDCMYLGINVMMQCIDSFNIKKQTPLQVSDTIDNVDYFRRLGFEFKYDQSITVSESYFSKTATQKYGDMLQINAYRYIDTAYIPYQIYI